MTNFQLHMALQPLSEFLMKLEYITNLECLTTDAQRSRWRVDNVGGIGKRVTCCMSPVSEYVYIFSPILDEPTSFCDLYTLATE